MKWRKLGLIFSPSGQCPWMRTHASLPVALHLGGDRYRIYFSSRDERNRSHVGYVEVDIRSPRETAALSGDPVLGPGPLGHFDEHGVYAASIVENDAAVFLYYSGWNAGVRPPLFYASIGLAISGDGGKSFRRFSPAPIMARSPFDPCLVTSPFVMRDGGLWRMWYVSGFKWEEREGSLLSYYNIKYAESDDGIRWERNGLVCVDHRPGERNIARPCVRKEAGLYRMWYAYDAGQGYRIGYAESADGYRWTRRDDEAGIAVSESGWDSRAQAYPWVFAHGDRRYMLYNGNLFGREGFGLAVED
jgi:hypothetical protein